MRVAGIILILFLTFSCDTESNFSIPEENYFVKFYGDEGEQEGVDFIMNTDGSVVMLGNTNELGTDQQIYVVKVDSRGLVLWQRSIGLTNKNDIAKDIELHPDGRIVIAGETEMSVGDKDIYIKTLSQSGDQLDSARYGLPNNTDEEVNSVSIVNGGGIFVPGFIVTGATTESNGSAIRDAMALRFDNSLQRILEAGPNPIWTASRYGYISDDIAIRAIEIDPATIYFFGYSNRVIQTYDGDYNFWYYALSGDGTPKLGEYYFGKESEDERLTSVEITFGQPGIRYLLSGTATNIENAQSFIGALSPQLSFSSGDVLGERNPTTLGLNTDDLLQVKVKGTVSNSYLMISSETQSDNQGFNIALTRLRGGSDLTPDSEVLIFGGEGDDFAGSVAELPNGRILLMGTMTIGQSSTRGQKKMVLMKLNSEGKLAE